MQPVASGPTEPSFRDEAEPLNIEPRNVHFEFVPELPVDWHSGNPAISHFYDALSLTFPLGERFFIDSVRRFADQVTDPELQRDIKAFYAQEATHSREHSHYNKLLSAHGIPVEKFERLMERALHFLQKYMPAKSQLAATCAYEHYTALFAESILGDPRVMAGAHPLYRDLWRWHAMEEEEHKAVAFNVYQSLGWKPGDYIRRVLIMGVATIDFMIAIPLLQLWLMIKTGNAFNLRAWAAAFWHLWVSPGIWRHVMLGVFSYLKPGFHPNQRKVNPAVLEWRKHYQASQTRPVGMKPTLFGEE